MAPEKIGFIGAGNVAEALIRGIITSGYLDPGQILISDKDQARRQHVNQTLGTAIAHGNVANAEQADILFLSVKPWQIADVAKEIRGVLRKGQFVISVAAGTDLGSIEEHLGAAPSACRIMPNLSASVRKSFICLYANPSLSNEELSPVNALLSRLGKVFRIEDEYLMAVITALSGSAPAYYVMMADALVKYGISQGLPKELATSMILGTMEGSAAWAANAKIGLDELWKKVVTPGGTTEAGINYYQEKGFVEIFLEGLDRSTRRARELGDK